MVGMMQSTRVNFDSREDVEGCAARLVKRAAGQVSKRLHKTGEEVAARWSRQM